MNDTEPLPASDMTARVLILIASIVGASGVFVLRRQLLMALPACTAGHWNLCFGTFNGVGLVTLVGLPIAVLTAFALTHHRRKAGIPSARRLSVAEVGMVYGTLPWVWITMLPGSGAGVVQGRVSLVPFRDLATMDAGQVIGNLLLLAALGFFAPVRFRALASLPRMLALGAACSLLIEVAQYVLMLDRVSSVDDVLLNTAGVGLAALASRPWWRIRRAVGSLPPALAVPR